MNMLLLGLRCLTILRPETLDIVKNLHWNYLLPFDECQISISSQACLEETFGVQDLNFLRISTFYNSAIVS